MLFSFLVGTGYVLGYACAALPPTAKIERTGRAVKHGTGFQAVSPEKYSGEFMHGCTNPLREKFLECRILVPLFSVTSRNINNHRKGFRGFVEHAKLHWCWIFFYQKKLRIPRR